MLNGVYPKLMGVLNVTPDSFYDGGKYNTLEAAVLRAQQMVAEGADIIDIGGESTRPQATPITPETECERVIPLITALKATINIPISIDTYHPTTLNAAIAAGVDFVNDITALQNPDMMRLVAHSQLPVCIMHMQGTPQTMQANPQYYDVVEELVAFFEARIIACEKAGIVREKICIDPGFGFGKTLKHNMQILANLKRLTYLGCPVVIGLSRKSMFNHLLGCVSEDRLIGSITAATIAALQANVIIRAHDVKATRQAIQVIQSVQSLTTETSEFECESPSLFEFSDEYGSPSSSEVVSEKPDFFRENDIACP